MKTFFFLIYCFVAQTPIVKNNGDSLSGSWKIVEEVRNDYSQKSRHKYLESVIVFNLNHTFIMNDDTVHYLGSYNIVGSDPEMIELYFEEIRNDSIVLIRDDLFFVDQKSKSEMKFSFYFPNKDAKPNYIRLLRIKEHVSKNNLRNK